MHSTAEECQNRCGQTYITKTILSMGGNDPKREMLSDHTCPCGYFLRASSSFISRRGPAVLHGPPGSPGRDRRRLAYVKDFSTRPALRAQFGRTRPIARKPTKSSWTRTASSAMSIARSRRVAPCRRLLSRANNAKSKVRSRVEHVFAEQKARMDLFIRTVGIARPTVKPVHTDFLRPAIGASCQQGRLRPLGSLCDLEATR